jgi:anthranilate synthase component 1
MNAIQFAELARQGYNRIPISCKTLADLDTPVSAYLKIARGPYSYLLESSLGGEKWGRYSIIGLPCRTVLKVTGHSVTVETDGEVVEQTNTFDPLAFVEAFQARFRVPELPEFPRFYGGLVGYFGYDCVRYVEERLARSTPPDTLETPDILLMLSEEVVIFDNLKGHMQLISLVDPRTPTSTREPPNCSWTGQKACNGRCRTSRKRPPTNPSKSPTSCRILAKNRSSRR